ncbi:MAG: glycosyltransferase [Clostridia bacterium]|nr:glycosyltransferase [Clostridia bacterium]
MILSRTLFPTEEICPVGEMYFKGTGYTLAPDGSITFKSGGRLSTSTYFNSFSLEKWVNYTVIDNLTLALRLSGDFELRLYMMTEKDGKVARDCIMRKDISADADTAYKVDCRLEGEGILYFELTAASDGCVFYGHEYESEVDTALLNPVELAIGICTFRREEYVISNLKRLDEAIKNPASPLYSHAHVYVSDNGSTLDIGALTNENISVVYNKNYGGAGGFTRTLIESMRGGRAYTNFIFMDDDIVLDVRAVEKNFILLQLLKDEHRESVIGGAMFSTDKRSLQFENGAKWDRIGFNFHLRDVDLTNDINIVLNEKERDVNYNAWCYCCVPYSVVRENNLPLPIFFHMDDVEFGLRNKLPVLSMNGINVWHLYKKGLINPKNDYYDIRNKLIMLASVQPESIMRMAHIYLNSFTVEIFKHHYARAINAFDGILDFCRGFDYFKSLDTSKKHASLYSNVKWVKADDSVRRRAMTSLKDGYGKRFKTVTLLKLLFKPKKREAVIYGDNSATDATKARRITVLDAKEGMCITYKKNIFLLLKCLIKYFKTKRAIEKKLRHAMLDYRNKINTVQNLDYWCDYLGLEKQTSGKRVLFAASDNSKTSGAFRSMVTLATLLRDRHGIDPTILLPKRGDGVSLLVESNLKYLTVESEDWIVDMDEHPRNIKAKSRLMKRANKRAAREYRRILAEGKYDLVHINTSYHYAIAEAAYSMNVPLVWHVREFLEEDQHRCFVDKKYAHSLMAKATKIVAISDSIEEKYKALFGDRVTRIYNGIDPKVYYAPDKTVLDDEEVKFICVGEIAEYKGQYLLVKALGELLRRGFDKFSVDLIGNLPLYYRPEITALIQENRLADKVNFLGRQSHVEEFYRNSDIMFVGSRSEAFGRITVEAMLSGCLVIGANTAGTKEILDSEKYGMLFELGDISALADKIESAINDRSAAKELAARGREHALSRYSAESNADSVHALYNELLEGERK